MKRAIALLLLLSCLPMTKVRLIRKIRCYDPCCTFEELAPLSEDRLRAMLPPGM